MTRIGTAFKRTLVAALLVATACSPGERNADVPPSPDADGGVLGSAVGPPPLRFAVKGDWGAGTTAQRAITRRMCATRTTKPFRYVVTTGDNFYPRGTATTATYHEPERCLRAARTHAWRASWGNHDAMGESTRTVLGARRTYSWAANDVAFFMVDSNHAASGPQRRWLRERLAASTARAKIVVFHHPPFTGSKHEPNATVRTHWVTLFEQHKVTLVLNGHNHAYEHHRVRGVHYVVSGGGGAALYPCVRTPASMLRCVSTHHFLLVYVAEDRVVVRAVDASGRTVDAFRIPLP